MSDLFAMTFGRVFFTLAASPLVGAVTLLASFSLCIVFWLTLLRTENKRLGIRFGALHYLWVALFICYLIAVYRLTGIGTLWTIIGNNASIRLDAIHLIPLASFADGRHGLLFFVLNIAMTIPLGLFLAGLWPQLRSLGKIIAIGFCFSLAIELSQLFTMRGTNVDDLIANTLGAAAGYLLFVLSYRLLSRCKKGEESAHALARSAVLAQARSKSRTLYYEGIIYIALSFLGMFLFFNSAAAANLESRLGISGAGGVISIDTTDPYAQRSDLKGYVVSLDGDAITIQLVSPHVLSDDSMSAAADERRTVKIDSGTRIDIWRIDDAQIAVGVAMDTRLADIRVGDLIDVTFAKDLNTNVPQDNLPAEHIIVWR
jgi:glycopeptide antibiotics resistance protein